MWHDYLRLNMHNNFAAESRRMIDAFGNDRAIQTARGKSRIEQPPSHQGRNPAHGEEPQRSAMNAHPISSAAPFISFIIPAFNEERLISDTIKSIRSAIGQRYTYEIIVIDNGSTDSTVKLCRMNSTCVYIIHDATIGGLRNIGVRHSRGEVLIFIDADVTLTREWAENIDTALENLQTNPLLITGSRCSTPDNAGWVAKAWFNAPDKNYEASHMGTGHLITTKKLFIQAGGFPENVPTGEDYIFCSNAKNRGAKIIANPKLRVIHHGVPRTLRQFIKRETWHGIGDWLSLSTITTSKVALLTLAFVSLHLAAFISLVSGQNKYALICLLGILLLCSITAIKKYQHASLALIAQNAVLFYFYFAGRSYSIIRAIIGRTNPSSPRTGH